MSAPFTVPPERAAVRVKPSGATSALAITKSVIGPIPAKERKTSKERVMKAVRDRDMLLRKREF